MSIYAKEYNIKNSESVRKRARNYYYDNRKISNNRGKLWRDNNKEHRKEQAKVYRKEHKALCNTHCQNRRAKLRDLLHPDHNILIEKTLQDSSIRISKCLGILHHVDHILPLNQGGFHHHLNLQIIPATINESKGDKLDYRSPYGIHWSELPEFLLVNVRSLRALG